MPDKLEIKAAYDYLRDEIKREDEILNQRLTTSLTFQGFLITALAFLLSNQWADTAKLSPSLVNIQHFKFYTLIGIGAFGLTTSVSSLIGIVASQRSTQQTIDWWEDRPYFKECKDDYPSAYGLGDPHRDGHLFARLMPISFIAMWTLYLIAMGLTFFSFNI